MNIVLLKEKDKIAERLYEIREERVINHIITVLKLGKGEFFSAGEVNGMLGRAEILEIDAKKISLKFYEEKSPPPKIPFTLICAVPRPKFLKRIIRDSVTLGVEKIYFLKTWKVEKSFFESSIINREKMDEYVMLGLEQAKDSVVPHIEVVERFKPFVEDRLPGITEGMEKIIAHPGGDENCPYNLGKKTAVAIGPEGGFTDYEVEMFEKQGFYRINIGERILRVESAIPFIIGRLS